MNIGLISDVHGNPWALEAVLSFLWKKVDLILFLGDLVGYYPFVNECAAMLDSKKVIGVRGNHDEILLRCIYCDNPPDPIYNERYGSALKRCLTSLSKNTLRLLKSWSSHRHLIISSVSISMFHGSPWDPLGGRVYPDFGDWQRFNNCSANIILLGHTHYPFVKRWNKRLIANPGSVGQPRDDSRGACCAKLDLASGWFFFDRVVYNSAPIIQDALIHDSEIPYLVEVLRR